MENTITNYGIYHNFYFIVAKTSILTSQCYAVIQKWKYLL